MTMAPSPQQRQVLQAASTNVIVAPIHDNHSNTTSRIATTTTTTSTSNMSGKNKAVKHPRTVVMMRTASQNTDDGDSQYKRTADSTSSLSYLNEEEALAVASARMGENVYDSPNTVPRKTMTDDDFIGAFSKQTSSSFDSDRSGSSSNHHHHHRNHHHHHHRAMNTPTDNNNNANDDEFAAQSAGLIASGLAWVQRSRESRRRKYLQSQAEKQLRKIRDAECNNSSRTSSSSSDLHHHHPTSNPTFLQMRNFDGRSATTNTNNNNNDGDNVPTIRVINPPKLSKSGEGASAQLDWNDLHPEDDTTTYSIPKVRVAEGSGGNESPYILTPDQMHQIAIHVLPKSVAYNRWKRIYGLGRDGDSFDGCLRLVEGVSRTLMVVRTTKGEIFGGYADSPWHSQAQKQSEFYGGAGACLFSIVPTTSTTTSTTPKVKVFNWTGKNRYIQLCDVSRKMLAFGGGGEDGVFGLAVEEDFQKGSTGPCDTFDNEQLCSEEIFQIVDLEFWEFRTGMF